MKLRSMKCSSDMGTPRLNEQVQPAPSFAAISVVHQSVADVTGILGALPITGPSGGQWTRSVETVVLNLFLTPGLADELIHVYFPSVWVSLKY